MNGSIFRIEFLGSPVDSLTMQEALQQVEHWIRSRQPRQIVPLNASKLWQMSRNVRLAEIVWQVDLVIPEYAIVLGSRFLGTPLKAHVGGSMLAMTLLSEAEKKNYRIFLLGARPEVLEQSVRNLHRKHPRTQIVGWHHGYFSLQDEPVVIRQIQQARPDILLVALGTPKQEYWIRDHLELLNVPVSMGAGGTIDVLAGIKKDAPPWVRKYALEWLYRLIQDPRNLWKRYLITIPWFVAKVLLAKFQGYKPQVLPVKQ